MRQNFAEIDIEDKGYSAEIAALSNETLTTESHILEADVENENYNSELSDLSEENLIDDKPPIKEIKAKESSKIPESKVDITSYNPLVKRSKTR